MASTAPGWHTDELVEEWVESSPSPPPTLSKAPQPQPQPPLNPSYASIRNVQSLQAKRGSLRGLGHAPARGLPPSRSQSLGEDKKGHDEAKRQVSGLLSPPSSGDEAASAKQPIGTVAGTFVVKEGVEDDRGHHLARAGAKKGGKDIFGALPLERMFEPPSPPVTTKAVVPVPAEEERVPEEEEGAETPSPIVEPSDQPRRVSHPYAPINPSRLSKSVTPSTASSSFSGGPSGFHLEKDARPEEAGADQTYNYEHSGYNQDDTLPEEEQTEDHVALASHMIPEQGADIASPSAPQGEFSFAYPAHTESSSRPPSEPAFDPSEASHSTINGRHGKSQNPSLRLFRSPYNTYTRAHLSAIVDSIAIEPSPSPPTSYNHASQDMWSSPSDGTSASPSASGSGSGSTPSSGSDSRSSKRLRLSPPSPPRRTALKDWGAHGKAMMEKIRDRGAETSTASMSRSSQSRESDGLDSPVSAGLPNLPSDPQTQGELYRPGHRSNPSTTSSGYLRAAEDLMRRIKSRVVSDSASGVESPSEFERRILSETDENAGESDGIGRRSDSEKVKGKGGVKPGPSPRRLLRRLSASEEIRRAMEESSESEEECGQSDLSQREKQATVDADEIENDLEERQDDLGSLALRAPAGFNTDDLDRFISSSTINTMANTNTGTTISTSFVKHRGSKTGQSSSSALQNSKAGMRMIRPDEVAGLVPDRVGKMMFDRDTMRWVREGGGGGLARVSEAGETGSASRKSSEESEDVFAGLESWRDDVRDAQEQDGQTGSGIGRHGSTNGERDGRDTTDIVAAAAVETTEPYAFVSPPDRPRPTHTASAPPILTPAPNNPTPGPLRSALRQPNSLTPAPGTKKRAGWHEDLTPGPVRQPSKTPGSSGTKRSVSFSDGRKSGKIVGVGVEVFKFEARMQEVREKGTSKSVASLAVHGKGKGKWTPAEDFFNNQEGSSGSLEGKSWLPSTRTKRIENVLKEMEDLSLQNDTETPSKLPPAARAEYDLSQTASSKLEEDDTTVTIRPFGRLHASYKSRRNGNDTTGNGIGNATFLTECSFGVAHDKLVQLITDVQPFEPHWETLKAIDLSGRNVESLARLKEMLPVLEEVNLNDNLVSYLSGIPATVQMLLVANNKLTSLTSVNHLRNLKVLDLSSNQLDGVSQLACLHHLEDLKIDRNNVTDLGPITGIASLTKLSAAGNRIAKLDLIAAKWDQLESLELSDNAITAVYGLDSVKSLKNLDLDGNNLDRLACTTPLTALRTLRISDNSLARLDLANFPKLRILYADGNRLKTLERSSSLNSGRLENLSLRNQRGRGLRLPEGELRSVKRLYISGNSLPAEFLPSGPLPNLLYFEVAACSLSSLPVNLATRLPSLRILNANYNFLSSLDRLEGMSSLRKLTVVGCRLGGSGNKGSIRGLHGLNGLEEVDLRMNPSTLSFYLPVFSQPLSPTTENEMPLPRDKSYIQATTRAPPTQSQHPSHHQSWAEQDVQFRKSLPDEWYGRRLVYRGLMMRSCPDLEVLDGVKVEEGERRKAEELLRRAEGAGMARA